MVCFKHIAFCFVLFCLEIPRAISDTINIGFFNLPPQAFLDKNKKPVGAAIDYWEKHIAPDMNVTVKWIGPHNIKRLMRESKSGAIDAILIFTTNPERLKLLDFPDFHFTNMTPGILIGSDEKIDKTVRIEYLKNKKICLQVGAFIPEKLKKTDIEWVRIHGYNWIEQCAGMLKRKRIDAILGVMSLHLNYHVIKEKENFKLSLLLVEDIKNYTAFSKKNNGYFLKKYNRSHNRLMTEVDYDNLVNNYFEKISTVGLHD